MKKFTSVFPVKVFGLILMFLFLLPSMAFTRDWYIKPDGAGRKGTQEEPAGDLAYISSSLASGDVVKIAEGTYLGRGENGADVITVPVRIIGGYSPDFSRRDPWGAYQTVFSGNNLTKNFQNLPRLSIDLSKYTQTEMPEIIIDGIIVDQGAQNHYKNQGQLMIVRSASPSTGANPTPDRGGIVIRASATGNASAAWKITVQNCIVTNCAPTQGALAVFAYEKSEVTIRNNLIINNTGVGIYAGSLWKGDVEARAPKFLVENNTVLYTWKYEPLAQSYSGISFTNDPETKITLLKNVFAFADRFGIQKTGKWSILIQDTCVANNGDADYYEAVTDTRLLVKKILDEAETLHIDSKNIISATFLIPVVKTWLDAYGRRAEDSSIWLPRLSLKDAVTVAGKYVYTTWGATKNVIR